MNEPLVENSVKAKQDADIKILKRLLQDSLTAKAAQAINAVNKDLLTEMAVRMDEINRLVQVNVIVGLLNADLKAPDKVRLYNVATDLASEIELKITSGVGYDFVIPASYFSVLQSIYAHHQALGPFPVDQEQLASDISVLEQSVERKRTPLLENVIRCTDRNLLVKLDDKTLDRARLLRLNVLVYALDIQKNNPSTDFAICMIEAYKGIDRSIGHRSQDLGAFINELLSAVMAAQERVLSPPQVVGIIEPLESEQAASTNTQEASALSAESKQEQHGDNVVSQEQHSGTDHQASARQKHGFFEPAARKIEAEKPVRSYRKGTMD